MSDRPRFRRRARAPERTRLSWMVALLLLTSAALVGRSVLRPAPVGPLVQVRGDVEHPGWYETESLQAALDLAGAGLTAAEATLTDGTVVVVDGGLVSLAPPTEPLVFGLPLDVNTASGEALQAVPGIGPATASAIVQGRPYASLDQLLDVSGIGPVTLERLRPFLTAEP